ncbi:MAG: hypothetical protein HYX78_10460 [Armatimonadetes bacterium]|nr:hypothetical protein [Armatimonadota bacterium]
MDEINLSDYFQIIARRKRLIAATTCLALVVAAVTLLVLPQTYRGKAVLLFPQGSQAGAELMSKLVGLPSIANLGGSVKNEPEMYADILKSRTVSEQVVRDLHLDSLKVEWDDLKPVDVEITKGGALEMSAYVPSSWVKRGELEWLNGRYPNASLKRKTAGLAAELANTYVTCLQDFDRKHALGAGRRQRRFLEGEVEKTRQELKKAEEALERFKRANPVVPPPEAATQMLDQVIGIRTTQIEAEAELGDLARSVEEARGIVADQEETQTAAKVVQENPVVTQLKMQLAQAEVRKAQLLENMSESHPDVVEVDQEIAKTGEKIRQEVARVTASETLQLNPVRQALVENLANLEIKKSGVQARLDALREVMERTEGNLSRLAGDQMRYVRLLRDVKALDNVYIALMTEFSQAKVAEARDPEGFTVLDWAIPEKYHNRPKRKVVLLVSLMLGFIGGCFIALVQESGRARKHAPEQDARSVPVGRL